MEVFKMKKLFYLLCLSLIISACTPRYVTTVKNDRDGSFLGMAKDMHEIQKYATGEYFNGRQFAGFFYSFNFQDIQTHKKTVYYALNESRDGELVHWKSSKADLSGKVRVVWSYPTSDGLCRIYQVYVTKKSTTNFFTNKACKHGWNNNWSFLR